MKFIRLIFELVFIGAYRIGPLALAVLHFFESFHNIEYLILIKYLILLIYVFGFYLSHEYPDLEISQNNSNDYLFNGTSLIYLSVFIIIFSVFFGDQNNGFWTIIFRRYSILETILISSIFILIGIISLNKLRKELTINPNYLNSTDKYNLEFKSSTNLLLSAVILFAVAIILFCLILVTLYNDTFANTKAEIKLELILILVILVLIISVLSIALYSSLGKLLEQITKKYL